MSALLKYAKIVLLLSLITGSSVPLYAQSESTDNSTNNTSEEKETPAPADVSDLGKITIEGLKTKPVYWLCRNRDIVRTLRIEHVGGGCNTFYTKDGADKVMSQAMGVFSCVNVFGNIRRNLLSAGWKCKDIGNAKVSE